MIEFYSRNADFLGTKVSLAPQIHAITTTPIEALHGRPLSEFTINERIRWNANRQTKKVEDKAYCLLGIFGIFGIFMPFIYGERENALYRLQKEIDDKYGAKTGSIWQSSEIQREKIIVADWCSPADFASQQTDWLGRRQDGTNGRFLAHVEHQHWHRQTNSTFLCPGLKRSGKSVMVATVIHDLQTYFKARKDVVIAYLYCNYKRQAEQDLRSMLATLVRQLFQERLELPADVRALYQKHRDRATRPSVDELRNLLRFLVTLYKRTFIVIDALDELSNDE